MSKRRLPPREGHWKALRAGEAVSRPPHSTLAELLSASGLSNVPWNLPLCAALGVWLMFAPAVLQTTGLAANVNHLVGALVVTCSVIAFDGVARSARLVNLVLAAALLIAPWFLAGTTTASRSNDVAVAAALIVLSLPRGRITERFGTWNRWIW